jgi:hypothetical protein
MFRILPLEVKDFQSHHLELKSREAIRKEAVKELSFAHTGIENIMTYFMFIQIPDISIAPYGY